MEWTSAQQRVLEHQDGWLRVRGPAGSGKTAALAERWRRSTASGGRERVLVVCPSRDRADRFRRAALGERWWAGEDLPFTTPYGVAFDLVRRIRGDRRLLTRAEQWSVIRRLLAEDGPSQWPSGPDLPRRAAFVDEVSAGMAAMDEAGAEDRALLEVASAWGVAERWSDLLAFRDRYHQATAAVGAVDGPQLFREAAGILAQPDVAAKEAARWDEVLIDDADAVTWPIGRMIERLAPIRLIAAGDDGREVCTSPAVSDPGGVAPWLARSPWPATVTLIERHRALVTPSLVRPGHPACEPDAVAAVLLHARQDGVPWGEMAVLARRARPRSQGIGRALARHGIPVRLTPGSLAGEPAVQALIDFFAWAAGDPLALDRLVVSPALDLGPVEARHLRRDLARGGRALEDHPGVARLVALRDRLGPHLGSGDPAELAYQAWLGLLGGLVMESAAPSHDEADRGIGSRAVAAVSAFIAGVGQRSGHDPSWRMADELALVEGPDFDPDPWTPLGTGVDEDLVTVTTIGAAAGRTWDTVVVVGCLEGELPAPPRPPRFFDPAVVDQASSGRPVNGAPDAPPGLGERRRRALEDERRLFNQATSRARRRLVTTAAPAPGQLVSRFVAEAPSEAVALVRPSVARGTLSLTPAPETEGAAPIHAEGRLSLSATRLTTYADCPLRYFYQYTLGVRGPGGVAASMGTVVHAALAGFLDPEGSSDRTWAALEARAESLWSDASPSIAPYQPMREQARRDIFGMLESWWQSESARAQAAGAWPDVVAVEYPFDIDVGGHRVRGTIDRVDRVPGGLAIIDYKTGSKVPKPEEVAEDLQLATYHLAALRDPGLSAIGPPVSLQLCYLRSGSAPAQPITDEHAHWTEQRILESAARILAEDFEPSVEADCEYCEFWRLCPLQVQGRQVGPE